MLLRRTTMIVASFSLAVFIVVNLGCAPDMADQPRYESLESSNFFDNGMSARPRVEGTIARGELQLNAIFVDGTVDGKPAKELPIDVSETLLWRGRERFNIFCSSCHDRVGTGRGMVVQRGFPMPPSFHTERLRAAPVGHIYGVITNGLGRMPEHASMIKPRDRWAIVAYVRALQLSQYAEASLLSSEDQRQLAEETP